MCVHTHACFSCEGVMDIVLAVFAHTRLINPDLRAQLKRSLLHFMFF